MTNNTAIGKKQVSESGKECPESDTCHFGLRAKFVQVKVEELALLYNKKVVARLVVPRRLWGC
jgi:hypothetical protein